MSDYTLFELLEVNIDDHVAFATIIAPPMNIITRELFVELAKFGAVVSDDSDVHVVVLRSGDPDFFLAHYDVEQILRADTSGEPVLADELSNFHRMCETYRTMPKPTICEIAGRVGGGGNELAMSCDMRFGAIGKTVMNQMEVPFGILPGGSGTQRLPRLVGRGRAMEIVLGGGDIDAETAETWGLINRALPPDRLCSFVTELAKRIASYPPIAVQRAKQSLSSADTSSLTEGLLNEAYQFEMTLRDPRAQRRMKQFLDVGGQTRAGEIDLETVLGRLSD